MQRMKSYFNGHYEVGLLHGTNGVMKTKNKIMDDFKANRIQILSFNDSN